MLVSVITVIDSPLRQIRVWPLYLNWGSAMSWSSLLVGGGVRTAELAVSVPLKLLSEPMDS